MNYVYSWAVSRWQYDEKDPGALERWVTWLDSPYWDTRRSATSEAEDLKRRNELFASAME